MKDVFKKVHLSEKKKFFKEITARREVVLVKTETLPVHQVIASQIIEDRIMECDIAKDTSFNLLQSEIGVVSILIKDDKYFFNGLVTKVNSKIFIELQGDLFYLQRRKSARLDIPEGLFSHCQVFLYNKSEVNIDCEILDFSSGGCRIRLPSLNPLMKPSDILRLRITLGNRSPFDVKGEVRHVKPVKDLADLPQVLGIMFLDMEPGFESKMINLFMDLQREIFLKQLKK